MAIRPIDLSTVYSQMDKVAKYSASQDQNAQLANSVNSSRLAQTETEKARQVQQTAANKVESEKVKPDGKQAQQRESEKKQHKENTEEEEEEEKKQKEIKDPLLGQHIDITR